MKNFRNIFTNSCKLAIALILFFGIQAAFAQYLLDMNNMEKNTFCAQAKRAFGMTYYELCDALGHEGYSLEKMRTIVNNARNKYGKCISSQYPTLVISSLKKTTDVYCEKGNIYVGFAKQNNLIAYEKAYMAEARLAEAEYTKAPSPANTSIPNAPQSKEVQRLVKEQAAKEGKQIDFISINGVYYQVEVETAGGINTIGNNEKAYQLMSRSYYPSDNYSIDEIARAISKDAMSNGDVFLMELDREMKLKPRERLDSALLDIAMYHAILGDYYGELDNDTCQSDGDRYKCTPYGDKYVGFYKNAKSAYLSTYYEAFSEYCNSKNNSRGNSRGNLTGVMSVERLIVLVKDSYKKDVEADKAAKAAAEIMEGN
jgi:hypothetical protein